MDEHYVLNGISFLWDRAKAQENLRKHRIPLVRASEAFFDPFLRVVDASAGDETRDAIIGMDERWNLLFVVHISFENESVRLISARKATNSERRLYEN
jgi:uncharacterized DUF497 family protein